jgi:putative methyltransferase (TIGR04325 family)
MTAALIPAAAVRLLRRHACVFGSYDEALPRGDSAGYDSERIASLVRAKTVRLRDDPAAGETFTPPASRAGLAMAALVAQLARNGSEPVRVLDFGGACGAHYFVARSLAPQLKLRWCVVETAEMMLAGVDLEEEGLRFAASIDDAVGMLGGVDLVYSSGTLQYLPDPLVGLRALMVLRAPVLALMRLSLTEGAPFTMLQSSRLAHNGPGPLPRGFRDGVAQYPVTFLNRSAFEGVLSPGYRIAVRYRDESADHTTPRGAIPGSSYVCLRKEDGQP